MDITDLLILTKERGASDLHLSAGMPPTLRINGKLTRLNDTALSREDLHGLLYNVLTDEQKARFEERRDINGLLKQNTDSRNHGGFQLIEHAGDQDHGEQGILGGRAAEYIPTVAVRHI